jgi:tetratricopeptide (TPR) repeat protein
MKEGLTWPQPRYVDSIPAVVDDATIRQALDHLGNAQSYRPYHAHAYRMSGWIYLARGDLEQAVAAFERARAINTAEPMIDWETGLVYEQMLVTISHAPSTSLSHRFTQANISAPDIPIATPFCQLDAPQTCYAGMTTLTMPYAGTSDPSLFTYDFFFLHPPATASFNIHVPVGQEALSFVLGFDPQARGWGSDGAVVRIGITAASETIRYVFEQSVTSEQAEAGWMPGWADLSPWRGQTITVLFETLPGTKGDTTADWFGWANVILTSPTAARYATYAPLARMRAAWLDGGFNQNVLLARRDEAIRYGRIDEAQRWDRRASLMVSLVPAGQ